MLWTNSSKQNRKKWENIKKTDRKSAIIVWYCLKDINLLFMRVLYIWISNCTDQFYL
jgi:hypothetical protein